MSGRIGLSLGGVRERAPYSASKIRIIPLHQLEAIAQWVINSAGEIEGMLAYLKKKKKQGTLSKNHVADEKPDLTQGGFVLTWVLSFHFSCGQKPISRISNWGSRSQTGF